MHAIAAPGGHDAVLERARIEAERLFDAKATLLAPDEAPARSANGRRGILVPLRVRDHHIGCDAPGARTLVRSRRRRARDGARRLRGAREREREAARGSEDPRGRARPAVGADRLGGTGGAAPARALPPRRSRAVDGGDGADARLRPGLGLARRAPRDGEGVARGTARRSARSATSRSTSSRSCCETRASALR